jgi:hypothetical protein
MRATGLALVLFASQEMVVYGGVGVELGHLAHVDQELQVPHSTVENEAWALCRNGDHEWLKVSLYERHAFRVTEVSKEQPGYFGSTISDVFRVKTCSFCGFSSEQKKFSSIAV